MYWRGGTFVHGKVFEVNPAAHELYRQRGERVRRQNAERKAQLEAAVAELSKSDFVTVDTEFIRETTFWPILCLIQMAAPGVTALVDPMAPGMDLKSFFELMANEKVTKVFHAARQDVEIVFHLGGLIPHPIFDTQVAAMVCGFGDSVSYDQIVQKITGTRLDKSSRGSWPLSSSANG